MLRREGRRVCRRRGWTTARGCGAPRHTGYRWILRRGSDAVEFQTPGMLAEQVASDHMNVFLSVEEAEALVGAVESAEVRTSGWPRW